jgi:hypothetical protein
LILLLFLEGGLKDDKVSDVLRVAGVKDVYGILMITFDEDNMGMTGKQLLSVPPETCGAGTAVLYDLQRNNHQLRNFKGNRCRNPRHFTSDSWRSLIYGSLRRDSRNT